MIVPMLNPDGVIMGNNRVSISGSDLNREFLNPDRNLHPEIYYLKDHVNKLIENNQKPYLYIDMHSHSYKKSFFMYSNYFPLHDPNYYFIRILPGLI